MKKLGTLKGRNSSNMWDCYEMDNDKYIEEQMNGNLWHNCYYVVGDCLIHDGNVVGSFDHRARCVSFRDDNGYIFNPFGEKKKKPVQQQEEKPVVDGHIDFSDYKNHLDLNSHINFSDYKKVVNDFFANL